MGFLVGVAKLMAQTAGVLMVRPVRPSHHSPRATLDRLPTYDYFTLPQAETYFCQKTAEFIPEFHSRFWGGSEMAPSIPKAYGFVILVNVIGASFMLVTLSFKVGAARKEYKIDLPTMYATGKDKKSVTFNCIQRGHQQALETFSTVLACSLIGGIRYPLSTWIFGVGYIKSRMEWAKGYATGDPANRYGSKWGKYVWTTLVGMQVATIAVAVELLTAGSF